MTKHSRIAGIVVASTVLTTLVSVGAAFAVDTPSPDPSLVPVATTVTNVNAVILPTDYDLTERVSYRTDSGAWKPLKLPDYSCDEHACRLANLPEGITRFRTQDPKTREYTVYLIARIEPWAPLSAINKADIIDEPTPVETRKASPTAKP